MTKIINREVSTVETLNDHNYVRYTIDVDGFEYKHTVIASPDIVEDLLAGKMDDYIIKEFMELHYMK